jgi:hypothetical protein
MFLWSKARPACEAELTENVSRFFKQYGILNISQPYSPPRPVTRIA